MKAISLYFVMLMPTDSAAILLSLIAVIARPERLYIRFITINSVNSISIKPAVKLATFGSGVLLILFTLFIVLNLINSKTGRAVTAIRDNRIAAESVGIGITKYKLTAFIISAVIAGMAGALYAMNFSTIAAKKFDFNTSILILVFVVLGGMGNIPGTIIATTLLYMLPELLRQFADYRMLLYAIVLILVMLATNSEKVKVFTERVKGMFSRRKDVLSDGEGGASNG